MRVQIVIKKISAKWKKRFKTLLRRSWRELVTKIPKDTSFARVEIDESVSFRQIAVEAVFLLTAILAGTYYRVLTATAHRKTFSGTKTVIESRIKLECEREQQEQLLLSVIPAYIAAEVSAIIKKCASRGFLRLCVI